MKIISKIAAILMLTVLVSSGNNAYADSLSQKVNSVGNTSSKSQDYVGITIDGYFDDWEDKPHTNIYYTKGMEHSGSLFRDEENVYMHIKMSDWGFTHFDNYTYIFTADKVKKQIMITAKNYHLNHNGKTELDIYSTSGEYKKIDGATGYVYRKQGHPDEWEVKIPLKYFSSKPETISSVSFHSPNLGKQTVESVNSPTLPFVIAGSGLAIASLGFVYNKKKKSSCNKEDKGNKE